MSRPDVTICIPAWQAAAFIDRTLRCARSQTYREVRIVVSVDQSDDATESICRAHATEDPRIELIVQHERLGWSENANALLERVETEFHFLYFHDDLIAETYVERLRAALVDDPSAMSAHCDLERFGSSQGVDPAHHYAGSACRRLLDFMIGPVKGTPLRSLTRSSLLGQGLRFPAIGDSGFWRCHPFIFRLLSAGPALALPEVLYRRWFRPGSLTANWSVTSAAPLIEGQRCSARLCQAVIDEVEATPDEKALLAFVLYLFIMTWTRSEETRLGGHILIDAADIHAAFASARAPAALSRQSEEVRHWIREAQDHLLARESSILNRGSRPQSTAA